MELSPTSKTQYAILIAIMGAAGVLGSVLIVVLYKNDPLPALTLLLGFLTGLTATIVAIMKVTEAQVSLDGRLTQLLAMSKAASRAEGVVEGTQTERANPQVDAPPAPRKPTDPR